MEASRCGLSRLEYNSDIMWFFFLFFLHSVFLLKQPKFPLPFEIAMHFGDQSSMT